jgi:three-Cys-motif partner protein
MVSFVDPNPEYWEDYGPFQSVKHDLIRHYLGGWFPKLGTRAGRVIYMDTHAGRGRHVTGQPGSPLVALETLLTHSYRDRLLTKSEFRFLFIERDSSNLDSLRNELAALGALPPRVHVDMTAADAFDRLSELVSDLRSGGKTLAAAFVFVDPYGFKIPGELLRDLMRMGRVELFVNVIWRELDMAMKQRPAPGTGLALTLDSIFAGAEWQTIDGADVDTRIGQAVDLLAKAFGAKWATYIRMVSGGSATRYLLLHLTNHDDGRDLMKDCVWKVCPDGGYYAHQAHDPRQPLLIQPEPDLKPLERWVLARLETQPRRWHELQEDILAELWRTTHLNEVIRGLRREGRIQAVAYFGQFSAKANPVLRLP